MSDEKPDKPEKPEPPELPPASLELRQTRLRVEEGELVRRNDQGGVAMRMPLDDLESVAFVREWAVAGFIIVLVGGGLAAIARFAASDTWLQVVLYVAALLIGAFGFFALRGDAIVIRARGEEIRIPCPDPTDEVSGFAASLKHLCGGRGLG